MLILRQALDGMCFCQARCAVSQRAEVGNVSDGSSRSNFFRLGHLIISSAVEFPSFLWEHRSQSASALIYPLCLSLQCPALPSTTPSPPPPLPLPSAPCSSSKTPSLSCQEMAGAHLRSPSGDMLLFNGKTRISPLSCILICTFQGVSYLAVGAICYWRRRVSGAEMLSKTLKAFWLFVFGKSHLIKGNIRR